MRPAIHPCFSDNRRTASLARQHRHAICVQRNGKIPTFAIYVFVLLVEARAALGNRLSQDNFDILKQLVGFALAKRFCRLIVVKL